MSGSYIYDVVWCGLEMIENKQKQFSVTNYSSSRLLMPSHLFIHFLLGGGGWGAMH